MNGNMNTFLHHTVKSQKCHQNMVLSFGVHTFIKAITFISKPLESVSKTCDALRTLWMIHDRRP